METTNEIKAKVFAQYLGHKIEIPKVKGGKDCWFCTPSTILNIEVGLNDYEGTKLILKPLIAITDEDAIGVAKIGGASGDDKYLLYSGTELIEEYLMSSHSNLRGYDWWKVYQYLQSKGYDIPNYHLGGKTLHEAGLAIYE